MEGGEKKVSNLIQIFLCAFLMSSPLIYSKSCFQKNQTKCSRIKTRSLIATKPLRLRPRRNHVSTTPSRPGLSVVFKAGKRNGSQRGSSIVPFAVLPSDNKTDVLDSAKGVWNFPRPRWPRRVAVHRFTKPSSFLFPAEPTLKTRKPGGRTR